MNYVEKDNNKVMRPVVIDGWFFCPVCGQIVGVDNYCRNCGQRLRDGTWKKIRNPFERELEN